MVFRVCSAGNQAFGKIGVLKHQDEPDATFRARLDGLAWDGNGQNFCPVACPIISADHFTIHRKNGDIHVYKVYRLLCQEYVSALHNCSVRAQYR